MEYKTFGNQHDRTIMLLHGNLMCWKQFEHVIPYLAEHYRVIAVSFDGFDGTGKTTYPGAEKEAGLLSAYIKKECNGKLICLLAESLGCCPAAYLIQNTSIHIEHIVLSGPECLSFGILNPLLLKFMPQKQYKMVVNYKKPDFKFPGYLLKLTGQTQEKLKKLTEQMADGIMMESIRETWRAGLYLYTYIDSLPANSDAKVYCWYGEKEGGMKKALKKLNRAYPHLSVHCFKGYGHGEITAHPEQMAGELYKVIRD